MARDLITGEAPKTLMGILRWIFVWYPKEMPAIERKLLRKLDATILSFGAIAFFLKYLDSSNLSNAYVSGLKEVMVLNGNQYAWFNFFYYIGYMVFQVPTLLILSRGNTARWLMPGVELIWGLITFAQCKIKTPQGFYVIRFFLGALAIPSYTGVNFVLGSWYTGEELFKRAAVFMVGNSLGQMFSAYLVTATTSGLEGVGGLRGYEWLFIIDGIITVPIAIIGFIIFPGLPHGKKIWWLTEEEHQYAKDRLVKEEIAAPEKITLNTFKKVLSSWHIYLAVAICTIFLVETYPAGQMTLWLKSLKNADGSQRYSVALINDIPTAIFAIIALTTWLTGSFAGVLNIWALMVGIQAVNLFAVVILRIWNVPDGLKWAGYFCLGFMGAPNPLIFGWVNRLTRRDANERAIILGAMFTFGWAFFAWVPLIAYATPDAPRWTKGYSTAIACTIVSTALFLLGGYLHRLEESKIERQQLQLADKLEDIEGDTEEVKQEIEHHEHEPSHFTKKEQSSEFKALPNPASV